MIPKICERIRDQGHVLVIIDPTYKLLGAADENSATDVAALLNMFETLARKTGAAVALAGHYAKGNAAAKETIDRISGSGVFARDPDTLVNFTKHEEDGAFTVDLVLRNFAPVNSFVVRWQYPLFLPADSLDPTRLKQAGGRPAKHTAETLLEALGIDRLTSTEWKKRCIDDFGLTRTRFLSCSKSSKSPEKCKNPSSTPNGPKFWPSPGTLLMKMINKDGLKLARPGNLYKFPDSVHGLRTGPGIRAHPPPKPQPLQPPLT